jgi:hypothetical protein
MARSGQITVAAAGTAEQGPDVPGSLFMLAPHPDNSGIYVWVGESEADVSSDTGFPVLSSVSASVFVQVNNLSELYFDVSANGDKVCWLKIR